MRSAPSGADVWWHSDDAATSPPSFIIPPSNLKGSVGGGSRCPDLLLRSFFFLPHSSSPSMSRFEMGSRQVCHKKRVFFLLVFFLTRDTGEGRLIRATQVLLAFQTEAKDVHPCCCSLPMIKPRMDSCRVAVARAQAVTELGPLPAAEIRMWACGCKWSEDMFCAEQQLQVGASSHCVSHEKITFSLVNRKSITPTTIKLPSVSQCVFHTVIVITVWLFRPELHCVIIVHCQGILLHFDPTSNVVASCVAQCRGRRWGPATCDLRDERLRIEDSLSYFFFSFLQ